MNRSRILSCAVASICAVPAAVAAPTITSVLVTSSASGTPTSIGINGAGLCATSTVSTCTGSNLPTLTLGGTALTPNATPTSVTASLPVLAAGTYTLVLTAGASGSVSYNLAIAPSAAGATGATGAAGAKGATGATGATGSAGAAGSKGSTGATGSTGIAGAKGSTGSTGATGAAGSATVSVGTTTTGLPGSAATVTNTGTGTAAVLNFTIPTGATGPQGAIGPTGPMGNTGVAGSIGVPGTPGVAGAIGPQGPAGVTGATGSTGATGVGFVFRGAWSASINYAANDVVTANGNAYLATAANSAQDPANGVIWSVLAQAGVSGASGSTGATGATGLAGPTGVAGAVGATGPQGSAGVAGPVGAQGPTGSQGPIGPTGISGIQGPTGSTGPTGPAGMNGVASGYRGPWLATQYYAVGDLVFTEQMLPSGYLMCGYVARHPSNGVFPGTSSDLTSQNDKWLALDSRCIGVNGSYPPPPSPTGAQYVYVRAINSIYQFAIATGGSLQPLTPAYVPVGLTASDLNGAMAVDRVQHRLYTVNHEANSLSIFTIGPDGGLVSIESNFSTVANPHSVVIDATNQKLYVSGIAEVAEYSISADGSLGVPQIFPIGAFGTVLGADRQGRYVLTRTAPNPGGVNLVAVTNGDISSLWSSVQTGVWNGIYWDTVWDEKNRLVFTDDGPIQSHLIGPDGTATLVNSVAFHPEWYYGMARVFMNADRTIAYVIECGGGANYIHTLHIESGGIFSEPTPPIVGWPNNGLCGYEVATLDEQSRFLYVIPYGYTVGYQFQIGVDGTPTPMTSPTFGTQFPWLGGPFFLSIFGMIAVQY